MKATELRIGNLVYYTAKSAFYLKKDGDIIPFPEKEFEVRVLITSISENIIGVTNKGLILYGAIIDESVDILKLEPVPLTEEMLLKAGFIKEFNSGCDERDHNSYYYSGKEINLTIDFELGSSDHLYECLSVTGSQKLKYVHQLQNLYFALTGEELKYEM